MDWVEESDLVESATRWLDKVKAEHESDEYETWGIDSPVDEMIYLLDFRRDALAKIDRLHQQMTHLHRIVEANPGMRVADAVAVIDRPRGDMISLAGETARPVATRSADAGRAPTGKTER